LLVENNDYENKEASRFGAILIPTQIVGMVCGFRGLGFRVLRPTISPRG
jgi:hypothetical protein